MNLSDEQKKLINDFNRLDLIDTCKDFNEICLALVFYSFFNNISGTHVEWLKKYYKEWLDSCGS